MKAKKFSKEWFESKLIQLKKMQDGTFKRLTATKGYKPINSNDKRHSKKQQRIESLKRLAKDKGIKLGELWRGVLCQKKLYQEVVGVGRKRYNVKEGWS